MPQLIYNSIWQLDETTLIDPASLLSAPGLPPSAIQTFLGKANSFTIKPGRDFSEGYVLATGAALATMMLDVLPNRHRLVIYDGTTRLEIHNLFIRRCFAITPGVISHVLVAGVPDPLQPTVPTELSPTTIYLVHLVDCRYFADWTSLDEEKFNWRDADGEVIGNAETSYHDLLQQIWTLGNLDNLLGSLTLASSGQALVTQQYRFTGESAWEAFHRVLEDAGGLLLPDLDHTAFTADDALNMTGLGVADQALFDLAKQTRLLDGEGSLNGPNLPETVRVHFHTTGQQYYECDRAETPQDCWQNEPHDVFSFDTFTLLQTLAADDTQLTCAIIPSTTLSLWSPLVAYVAEDGQYVDYTDPNDPGSSQLLQDALESYATEYLFAKWMTGRKQAWTFAGLLTVPLTCIHANLTYFDYGDGLKSCYQARQLSPLLPQREYPGKPDVHRRSTPYTRIAYAQLRASGDVPAADTEVFDEPGDELTQGIVMVLLYTRGGKWYSTGHSASVYPFSSLPLLDKGFYHCHYNYQAGDYGQWYPFSGGGSSSLWYIGKTTEIIVSEATGTVEKYDELWQATGTTFTVLNPHQIDLPSGLRVRWTKYPGWTDWIVEPYDYTSCVTEEA